MELIIESIVALIALSAMEIVLGIDNLVFISILTSKLPIEKQAMARKVGLSLALGMRILLLSMIFWLSRMTAPVFHVDAYLPVDSLQRYFMMSVEPEHGESTGQAEHASSPASSDAQSLESAKEETKEAAKEAAEKGPHEVSKKSARKILNAHAWREFNEVSWRDIILLAGGLFLLYKSAHEIHSEVEGHGEEDAAVARAPSLTSVLIQIAMMDIIFSLDSVITAVGMANDLWVMIAAVILAVGVMILFANQVGNFVSKNPTVKMLALNFLLIIGIMLIAEGIGTPISKGYIYFAMGFSLMVEFLNLRVRKKSRRRE